MNNTREELLTEYYTLINIVQNHDKYFICLKIISIILGTIILTIGIWLELIFILTIVLFLSLAFWSTEMNFKLNQLTYLSRLNDLEEILAHTGNEPLGPKVILTCLEIKTKHKENKLWKTLIFADHIMLPHIILIMGSLIGVVYLFLP